MALEILVNTGSGNALLPNGTNPLPEPVLNYHQLKVLWQEGLTIPISISKIEKNPIFVNRIQIFQVPTS